MSEASTSLTVTYAFSWGVGILLSIAMMVVGLTVVRRASTEAGTMIAISAVITLLSGCVTFVVPLASNFIGRGGDGAVQANMVSSLLGALLHLGSGALLLAGIARLASSSRPTAREPG